METVESGSLNHAMPEYRPSTTTTQKISEYTFYAILLSLGITSIALLESSTHTISQLFTNVFPPIETTLQPVNRKPVTDPWSYKSRLLYSPTNYTQTPAPLNP